MGNVVANISKGRAVEFYNRVHNNDPTNAQFMLALYTGVETDDNLRGADTIAAIEALTTAESTDGSYARLTFDPSDGDWISFPSPDDTNDRYDIDLPDRASAWTGMTGETLTRAVIGYDSDSTTGTDANILPVAIYDFSLTTDGTDINLAFNAQGFLTAG